MKEHRFNYEWYLKDGYPAKGIKYHGKKVFSCFACGGGSTMGYKLAGYNVIGFNEIDPKMANSYIENHNPKYSYIEPIQTFKERKDLPKQLYELDILDGSPPCSSFSISGNRQKDWGKEKKFREGQSKQVLDTLFFDFIDLAKELKPKVVIAENVKGLLLGNARQYLTKILKEFDKAGYDIQYKLLNASKMGVPQRRERVIFYGLRKDLSNQFMKQANLFDKKPYLDLEFNEKEIIFDKVYDKEIEYIYRRKIIPSIIEKYWSKVKKGKSVSSVHETGSFFNYFKLDENKVCPTLTSQSYRMIGLDNGYCLSENEMLKISSFPLDYIYAEKNRLNGNIHLGYLTGMSVPPVMIAQISDRIYNQWLSKI